jgi:membrane protein DedA with SNARE-associated domain
LDGFQNFPLIPTSSLSNKDSGILGLGIKLMELIDQIKQFLDSMNVTQLATWGLWSYILLAFLVAIEGPIATLLGAAAASQGLMHPVFVFIAAAAGNLTSDTLWYSAGLLGKMEWLFHFGRRLGINPGYIEKLEAVLHKHAPVILFFSKLTVSPMIPALIATGLIKYPWRRWFPSVFTGEMIWTGSLMLIGYFGLIAIKKVQLGIEHVILAGTIVFILFIILLGRRFLKKEIQNQGKSIEEPSDNKV